MPVYGKSDRSVNVDRLQLDSIDGLLPFFAKYRMESNTDLHHIRNLLNNHASLKKTQLCTYVSRVVNPLRAFLTRTYGPLYIQTTHILCYKHWQK